MRFLSAIWGRMEQLQRYATFKELHVKQMEVAKELDMARVKSTKVALCS
jgi:hypothetical protein